MGNNCQSMKCREIIIVSVNCPQYDLCTYKVDSCYGFKDMEEHRQYISSFKLHLRRYKKLSRYRNSPSDPKFHYHPLYQPTSADWPSTGNGSLLPSVYAYAPYLGGTVDTFDYWKLTELYLAKSCKLSNCSL